MVDIKENAKHRSSCFSSNRVIRVNVRKLCLAFLVLLLSNGYFVWRLLGCWEEELSMEPRSHTGSEDGVIVPDTFFCSPKNAKPCMFMAKRKWRRLERERALVLWMGKDEMPWADLHRDQIPNHLYFERDMTNKGEVLASLKKAGFDARQFIPETYRMWMLDERKEFFDLIGEDGITTPWLIKLPHKDKGTGIFPLASNEDLAGLREKLAQPEPVHMMTQRYVHDPVLLNKRKFDLRIYWLVVSVDPLIVLYHDGTLRVALTEYDGVFHKNEDGTTNLAQHLTNAIVQKSNPNYSEMQEESRASFEDLETLLAREFPDHPNPMDDVRCQIQSALIMCIQSIRKRNIEATMARVRNAYSLFGADFVIDKKLRLWMSEVQSGPGLPMAATAVRKVMENMLPEMIDLVQEIRVKQNQLEPVLPLDNLRGFVPIVLDHEVLAPSCPNGKPILKLL